MLEENEHMKNVISKIDKNTDTVGDALAQMRTLLALERNYLAEERTQLAQFRTGIALALFAFPSGALYIPSSENLEVPAFLNIIIIGFFIGITIVGIYWMISAHLQVNKIRKRKKFVNEKEAELLQKNEKVRKMLADCFEPNCDF